MKVPPPEEKPYNPTPEHVERQPRLKGALDAFNDTPAAAIIIDSLKESGNNPAKYNIEEQHHCNYYGLPTTMPTGYGDEEYTPSPIVYALAEKIENGEIIEEKISMLTHERNYQSENDSLLRNVYAFTSVLKDPESGQDIAFLADLKSDGGKRGEVLLSTKDVVRKDS